MIRNPERLASLEAEYERTALRGLSYAEALALPFPDLAGNVAIAA